MKEISLDEFQKILAHLVGRAESADGLIRAEWTTENGLRLLHIDPRAKDRGLDALADAVMKVSNMALEDLKTQIRQVSETVKNTDGAAPDITTPAHEADQAAASSAETPTA